MNILLTGGAGYIGSHTSLLLIDKGHAVTILDNLISGNSKLIPNKANFLKTDIADEKKIKELLRKKKFDLVMHFAGLVKENNSDYKNKICVNSNKTRSNLAQSKAILALRRVK